MQNLRARLSPDQHVHAELLSTHLLRRVSDEDLHNRPVSLWSAIVQGLLSFMQVRKPGSANVRVFNPSLEEHQWETGHTIVEVVTDDSPFLVDSISMAITSQGGLVHSVLHPVLGVVRDEHGQLQSIHDQTDQGHPESITHFEIDRRVEPDELATLKQAIEASLVDVSVCVRDWQAMRQRVLDVAESLSDAHLPVADEIRREAQEFLRWVAADHFTLLGYREYRVAKQGAEDVLQVVENSGLGLLRHRESVPSRPLKALAARELQQSGPVDVMILTKTNAQSTVHRTGYMDYLSVLRFDLAGKPVGEQRFLGLFTSSAYSRRPVEIPWIRQKYAQIMERSGFKPASHSGRELRHILENLPRDELFQATTDELHDIAMGILALSHRQRTRLFARLDRYGRFYSCLVFLPRDRFDADVRERVEGIIMRAFGGERFDTMVQLSESALARMHVVVRVAPQKQRPVDLAEVEKEIAQVMRNWHDELRDVLVERHGQEQGIKLAHAYGRALSAHYIEEATPWVAASDVETAAQLHRPDDIRLSLYRSRRQGSEGALRFKLFRYGAYVPLSDVLPMMENVGLRVLSEHPHVMHLQGQNTIHIQDFEVATAVEFDLEAIREAFQHAFERIWRGEAENDGFNRLILNAGLNWRQITVLRALCKYLLQTGVPFSQAYVEATLNRYPLHARLLVELFEAKFDPGREQAAANDPDAKERYTREFGMWMRDEATQTLVETLAATRQAGRQEQIEATAKAVHAVMDRVSSLDEDRILRSYLGVLRAALRTNFYQLLNGTHKEYVSFKFDSAQVPDLPKPKPYREIFVYSPRVEGVHLRFGPVARGGLRWSDRREDFRTEVLGLVKAQMVKNTVIVPVGAKGGFFVKRPPQADRDAQLAEGIACYRLFIKGLLDVTDNWKDGQVVHPGNVVRYDADDPYLVVAADKGTATFSDIANAISIEYGFWLGDAFASGGSVGYDHKKMGITAKGGWESVKRHFRALGRDCQAQDFTCVGIGDMSGDVFGNGMLLSGHIRLVAAFDHRHIFLDPNPDAATSFTERARLFALPRSSWDDYDKQKISAGGGVFPRTAKSIALSSEACAALGIEPPVAQITPQELIRAILKSPVDLLWNGGIGTYVKATHESHNEIGDRTNNVIRINGKELRCKIVGEGGNLGMSQLGRIEAALGGVLLNTDFIDNSAGVDTSDHEVNIKILLNEVVLRQQLTLDQRNALLAQMTDEVGQLVLRDNYLQNQAISVMEKMSVQRLGAMQHFVKTLEIQGQLDRQLEYLPSEAEFIDRKSRGQGLTRPELSILLSYSKIVLYTQLLDSDVPEDSYLSKELIRYFPKPLQERYSAHMSQHRLRREIIATAVTNSVVNRMGADFVLRMQEDTGDPPAQVMKAYTIAREVLGVRSLWAEIEALDGKVHGHAQIEALLRIWNAIRNATRWLLNAPGDRIDIAGAVERYAPGILALGGCLERVAAESDRGERAQEIQHWKQLGLPDGLAGSLAEINMLTAAFDIIEVAQDRQLPVDQVAEMYYALGEALHIKWLMARIEELPVEGRWHAQARGTLRDELFSQQRALTSQVLGMTRQGYRGAEGVSRWLNREDTASRYTLNMLGEMRNQVKMDYPTVSVAVRRLAQLVAMGARAH